jgi:hypothetical protein
VVKIGWLQDHVQIQGGAELSSAALVDAAPEWAEIVFCPENRRPPEDLEVYVLQNVVTYGRRWNEVLDGKRLVKCFRDPWHPGDWAFRRCVLDNLIGAVFNSPLSNATCPWPFDAPRLIVPPPVDLEAFRAAALPAEQRRGNVLLSARLDYLKGFHRAVDWVLMHDEPLEVYGYLNHNWAWPLPENVIYHGPVEYTRVPAVLGKAKRFVFLPAGDESFSRTTVEAWAAGCELVVDKIKIGAMYWLQNEPQALEDDRPVTTFWETLASWIL